MSFRFNPLSGNLDYYEKGSGGAVIGTRVNIFSSTPSVGTVAYATDVNRFYVYGEDGWHGARLSFGKPSNEVSMGAFEYEDDSGYGEVNLGNKRLHNVVVSYFDEKSMPAENGALRFSVGFLQVYVSGNWLNVYPMSAFEYEDRMLWSDEWQEFDYYGKNIIHGNKVDIGPFASDHIIDGGLISEQVVI